MPDRLPSLVVLVGFWIPPAVAGLIAAGSVQRAAKPRHVATYVALAAFVVGYAAVWFLFNRSAMPPYIPGAVPTDPRIAPPRAVANLAVVAGALVLPGSALACALAYRWRRRSLVMPLREAVHSAAKADPARRARRPNRVGDQQGRAGLDRAPGERLDGQFGGDLARVDLDDRSGRSSGVDPTLVREV